jgi:putative ABC transport system permease protein
VRLLRRSMLREVRGRRGPFLAVIVTVALGVALFGASYDAFLNLTASYEQLYTETHFADVTAVTRDATGVAEAAAAVPDVRATSTRFVADVPIEIGDQQLLGRAIGLPDDGSAAPVNDVLVLDGTRLDPSVPDGVLVERHMADNFHLAPGDTIRILDGTTWRDLKVLGTVFSPEYIWLARSRQDVFVLPDEFGVLFAPESLVAALPASAVQPQALAYIAPGAPDSATATTASAMRSAGALDVMTRAEQPSNALLQEDVSGFGEMSLAFPIMFLGAAAFATFVLLGRLIASQRGVIGTLRANGMARRTVTLHYASYGAAVGVIGSVLGALLGALLAGVISSIYTAELGIPSRVTDVRATTIAAGIMIGLVASIAAAWIPARRAAAMNPARAMRGVAPTGSGGESLLERVVPPLRRLPVRWRVALRGIGRSPRRSLATMGGVVFASILILASWGMIDTVDILMHRQFVDVARQAASVYPVGPVTQEAMAPIRAVDGVSQVEPGAEWPVTVSSGANSYLTQLTAFQPDTTMHGFYDPSGRELSLPSDGVLLGAALRDRLHVDVGATVTVSLATGSASAAGSDGSGTASGGQVSADATVAGFVNEPLGTPVYASLPYLSTILGGTTTAAAGTTLENVVYVRYAAGANGDGVTTALRDLDGVAAVVNNQALFDLMNQFLGLLYAFIGVMVVLGGILAFALIYNTLMASISERASEIAVLRTLGMPSRTVSRLIVGENLLLTAIGLVPGLIVGYLAAAAFMASFSSDMFQFTLEMRPTTLLLTALAIVVTGLLSQIPALRAVRHLELGRIVRERAT